MSKSLYDVLAVRIEAPNIIRFIAQEQTLENAEAIEKITLMRRGLDTEFYAIVPANSYKAGEFWLRNEETTC